MQWMNWEIQEFLKTKMYCECDNLLILRYLMNICKLTLNKLK